MKRFILVRTALDPRFPSDVFGVPWRATWVGDTTVDVFFYAGGLAEAKKHVRDRFPDATFSDEKRDSAQALASFIRTAVEVAACSLFLLAISVWWILT